MSLMGLTVLIAALTADPNQASAPVTLSYTAVQATNEGHGERRFERGLEKVQKALEGLDFDTFTRVASGSESVDIGDEARFPIDDHYALTMSPISTSDDGRVRVRSRITVTRDGKSRDALDTTQAMVPGKLMNLGGLPMGKGELVVVLSVGK